MDIAVSADWVLSADDTEWLKGYIREQARRAERNVRRCQALRDRSFMGFPSFTTNIPGYIYLGVHLTESDFPIPPNGVIAAGAYYDPSIFGYHMIRLNWIREFGDASDRLYQRALCHELGHALWQINEPEHYMNAAHGKNAGEQDIYLQAINAFIKDLYPTNHSSFPGVLPL